MEEYSCFLIGNPGPQRIKSSNSRCLPFSEYGDLVSQHVDLFSQHVHLLSQNVESLSHYIDLLSQHVSLFI